MSGNAESATHLISGFTPACHHYIVAFLVTLLERRMATDISTKNASHYGGQEVGTRLIVWPGSKPRRMPKKLVLYLLALRMHSTFSTLNVATAPKSGR